MVLIWDLRLQLHTCYNENNAKIGELISRQEQTLDLMHSAPQKGILLLFLSIVITYTLRSTTGGSNGQSYIYGCILYIICPSSTKHRVYHFPDENNNTQARDTVLVRHDPAGIDLTYLLHDCPCISSHSHLGSSSGGPRNIQLQTHETKPNTSIVTPVS